MKSPGSLRSLFCLLILTSVTTAAITLPNHANAAEPTPKSDRTPIAGTRTVSNPLQYVAVNSTRIFSGAVGTTPSEVAIPAAIVTDPAAYEVVLNVQVYKPTAEGYIRVTGLGADAPVSAQEFVRGQTISNLVTSTVVDRKVQVKLSAGSAQVFIDISGYYTPSNGTLYNSIPNIRVFNGVVGAAPTVVVIPKANLLPDDAAAASLNVEVFNPTNNGYVRITAAGADSAVSTQEFLRGQTVSNLTITKLANRSFQIKVSAGTARVLVDMSGYYTRLTGSSLYAMTPTRIADRTIASTPTPIPIAGSGGIPLYATSVAASIQVQQATHAGYVRLTPLGIDAVVATQEFSARQAISGFSLTQLSAGGIQVKLSTGPARVLLDIYGYFGRTNSQFTEPSMPALNFKAIATDSYVAISWTVDPRDLNFAGAMLRRVSGGSAVTNPNDGILIANSSLLSPSFTDFAVDPGTTYSYSLFTYNSYHIFIQPTTVSVTTPISSGGSVGTISGIVLNTRGLPLSNVQILYAKDNEGFQTAVSPSVYTSIDGRYSFSGLLPGTYQICAFPFLMTEDKSQTGYLPTCLGGVPWDVNLLAQTVYSSTMGPLGSDLLLNDSSGLVAPNLVVGSAGGIRGTVFGTDGRIASSGNIAVDWMGDSPGPNTLVKSISSTDEFRVPLLRTGKYSVCFNPVSNIDYGPTPTGYLAACDEIDVKPGWNDFTGYIKPSAAIQILVTDSQGDPLSGVTGSSLSISRTTGPDGIIAYAGFDSTVFATRSICFDPTLASGGPSKYGYLSECAYITLANGTTTTQTVVLQDAGGAGGRVTDTMGRPYAYGLVTLEAVDKELGLEQIVKTDDQGYFHITQLPSGQYFACVHRDTWPVLSEPGPLPNCQLSEDIPTPGSVIVSVTVDIEAALNIRLNLGAFVAGSVKNADGSPAVGRYINVYDPNSHEIANTMTDSQGTYSFSSLLPGTYNVCDVTYSRHVCRWDWADTQGWLVTEYGQEYRGIDLMLPPN